MNSANRPVSEILKNKDVEEPKKRSREDWRKAKELEEARKAGTAPAAVDEEGKDINPHIPQYIASAPWYFGASGPTLKHQRPQPEREKTFNTAEDYYVRGIKLNTATRYREGACENCGALTHKKKDCFERPRKLGAKFSGFDIAPDEAPLPELKQDYDGKRDRWNGYDPANYQSIVDEYAKVEEAKRHLKEEKLKQDLLTGEATTNKEHIQEVDAEEEDDEKYADNADMPGTKVDSKQRITVRNLRIREDIAKYLRNLDPNSAYYDPKTRAMRDNPYKSTGKNADELHYAGDNFVRYTGDTERHSQTQLFAWEAYEKGVDVHLQAEPTKAELLHKELEVKKEEFKYKTKGNIVEKYGGEEHLQVPPKELLFAQTEDYVEYSRHGQVIKGSEKAAVMSKYEEDVYINNHTSIWGSFWKDGKWGYKCCHSMLKNSYCTGTAGMESLAQASRVVLLPPDNEEEVLENTKETIEYIKPKTSKPEIVLDEIIYEEHLDKRKKAKRKSHHSGTASEASSSGSKADKMKKALTAEEEHQREADELLSMDERKRPYNSMYEAKAPTEEEMEAYFMKRHRPEDPMAGFLTR